MAYDIIEALVTLEKHRLAEVNRACQFPDVHAFI